MPLTFSMRVSGSPDVLMNVVDGQSVLLDLKAGRYFGLDEVGTRMWQVLTASQSVEAAYTALLAEYDVAPERLKEDLLALAEKLIENGLLEAHGG